MTIEGLYEDFRDLLVLFADTGVEFVIVGAYALALHGVPRASGDIDVLTEISGVTFEEVWESRVTVEVEGRAVGFIGRMALLRNKQAAGRPQDIADVARLRRIPPGQP